MADLAIAPAEITEPLEHWHLWNPKSEMREMNRNRYLELAGEGYLLRLDRHDYVGSVDGDHDVVREAVPSVQIEIILPKGQGSGCGFEGNGGIYASAEELGALSLVGAALERLLSEAGRRGLLRELTGEEALAVLRKEVECDE